VPFTVFHMGPGLVFKSIKPARFSLMTFGFTQVLIDLESAYWLYQQGWPIHRFNHTFLGAALITIVGVLAGKPVCSWLLRFWNSKLTPIQTRMLGVNHNITWSAAALGVVLGSFSHVFFDSLMHSDMKPFSPMWHKNPFLDLVSFQQLHVGCMVAGVVGMLGLLIHRIFRKKIVIQ
jgi:hypothetical protein